MPSLWADCRASRGAVNLGFGIEEHEKYHKDMLDQQSIYMNQRFYEQKGIEMGLEKGFNDGMEKGMEKGIEKGIEKEKLEMARNLKSLGVEVSIICQASGLTAEQVEGL